MIRLLSAILLLLVQSAVMGCTRKHEPDSENRFDSIPTIKPVQPAIAETSGMADSKKNKGFLWVHEDSGNPTQLYLLGHDGKVAKKILLKNVVNRDWEELQLSDGTIYLADIGDNLKRYDQYTIYAFAEPEFLVDEVADIKSIVFTYEDGPRDAEAFLVDAATKDIFIITKSDNPSRIYRLAYPYSYTSVNTAKAAGTLPMGGIVSAALSPDGKEIIVKTYMELFSFNKNIGQSIPQAFQDPFKKLPYRLEPQGEAVTFAADNSGYFTLSEKGFFSAVNLYFYKRG